MKTSPALSRCSTACAAEDRLLRQLRHADELPALQQDEGHGPDRLVVGPRRSLHCEGITKLFHAFVAERLLTKAVKEDIIDCCQKTIRLEDAFIDLAFERGPVPGMSPKEIKKYIRYIADWRLSELGFTSRST